MPGEDSVGIEVSIRHLAPTLPGMTAEITATVSAVEGRKVTFEIAAKDNLEPICAGSHSRFVVDKAKTARAAQGESRQIRRIALIGGAFAPENRKARLRVKGQPIDLAQLRRPVFQE